MEQIPADQTPTGNGRSEFIQLLRIQLSGREPEWQHWTGFHSHTLLELFAKGEKGVHFQVQENAAKAETALLRAVLVSCFYSMESIVGRDKQCKLIKKKTISFWL